MGVSRFEATPSNAARVNVAIDRLVLRGMDPAARAAFVDGLRSDLARMLADPATVASLAIGSALRSSSGAPAGSGGDATRNFRGAQSRLEGCTSHCCDWERASRREEWSNMSRSALIHDVDHARSSAMQQSSSVRVSHPGDSFEVEADRVADTVSRGGRVLGWSLSASGFDGIYRQPDPQPPAPASAGDVTGKLVEAILATPEGKKALHTVTAVATTPAGLVVTGAAAIGVVTAMDRAKKPLPAQAPAIPLDFIKPGLSVKIGYNGPVNKPTDGSITFSFSPKAAEKKPAQVPTEKLRPENAAMAADQQKVRAGLQTPSGLGPVKSAEDRMFEKWQMDKLAAIGNLGKSRATKPVAGSGPTAAAPAERSWNRLPHPRQRRKPRKRRRKRFRCSARQNRRAQ